MPATTLKLSGNIVGSYLKANISMLRKQIQLLPVANGMMSSKITKWHVCLGPKTPPNSPHSSLGTNFSQGAGIACSSWPCAMDPSWSLFWEGRKNRALPQPAAAQRRPSQGKAGKHHAIPKLTVLYGSELGQNLRTGLVTMKKCNMTWPKPSHPWPLCFYMFIQFYDYVSPLVQCCNLRTFWPGFLMS